MLGKRTFFGVLFAAVLAQPAAAAPATEEGAAKLLETFQMYLGQPVSGQAPNVTVKTDGDAYLVSFDLQAALKPFEASGLTVQPGVVTTHVATQDDGTYRVYDLKVPPLALSAKDTKIAYNFDGVAFDGIFDPKIAGFSKSETKFGKIGYNTVAPGNNMSVSEADINGQQTSTLVTQGVGTVAQHYTIGSLNEVISTGDSKAVDVAVGPIAADINVAGLHNQAIWDIWAFFVSHPDKDKITADAGTLKSNLKSLLPVFDKIEEAVKFTKIAVATPMGRFGVDELGFKIVATGAVESGAYGLSLSGAKPIYPEGMLQPWQANLVPTDFAIEANLAGFNADAAAKELIDGVDFAAKRPLSSEVTEKSLDKLWSTGPLKVTMAPSHINAATYQLNMSGDATINRQGPPTLHMVFQAKGLDATMDSLGAAKNTDPSAGQAVLLLSTAKGLGKSNTDGTMSWDVQMGADGAVVVNGTKVGGGGAK